MNSRYIPSVTIAITTYNRADSYLKQALRSALDQKFENIEIIVADNCSTDDTQSFVKSFADPRIKYYRHKKNIPANDNFNYCLDQANGEYFLLLHDDDLIDSDFIETCMNSVNEDTDIGIIRTGTRIIDEHGELLYEAPNNDDGLTFEEFIEKWFKWKTSMYLCSTIFNTRRLKNIGGFQTKFNLFQDAFADFQLASKYGRIDIQQVKASFRIHSLASTVKAKVIHWCEDSIFLLDSICDLINEDKIYFRKEGLKYFSQFNYELAQKIKSPLSRISTYFILFKYFQITFLNQIITNLLCRSFLYPPLKHLKKIL